MIYIHNGKYVGLRLAKKVHFYSKCNSIERIIGSKDNFKQLIQECFTNDVSEKEWWLKY